MPTYEVDDEAAVGGASGGPAEVGDTERGRLRREGGPEATGIGIGVAKVEHGREPAPPALAGRGADAAAAEHRRQEQLPRRRDPHLGEQNHVRASELTAALSWCAYKTGWSGCLYSGAGDGEFFFISY